MKWVIEKVEETGGIAYATEKMNAYKKEALNILHQFPESSCQKRIGRSCAFCNRPQILISK